MASWFDVISFVLTVGVIGGVVYGIAVVTKAISTSVESTKENLKGKGYTISGSGVSVKTNKRFDRESYVDATQRGFVKAVGASSFGKSKIHSPDHSTSDSYSNSSTVAGSQLSSPPLVNRTSSMGTAGSAGSFGSDGEKKSRNPFKRRTSSKS